MQYKNLEIHNVAQIVPYQEGGITWLRVPEESYNAQSDMGKNMSRGCTGVELRFVLQGETARITMQSLDAPETLVTFQSWYGGIQGGWQCHEENVYIPNEPKVFVFRRPENMQTVRRMNEATGDHWDAEVIRVIFNRGEIRIVDVEGDICPPEKAQIPAKTLLTYGSSITHGSNSYTTPDTWAFVLAHRLGMDIRNLGMAGSCRMEPEVVEYIASEGEQGNWDAATLELGINVIGWEDAAIREHVTNTIRQIAGRNPDKKIFVISPFYSNDDFFEKGNADRWRKIIPEICQMLRYENVVYIDGSDILGDVSLLSADVVHPNVFGVAQIADRLTQILEEYL